jgi:DUF1365 family protein
VNSCLYEGAVSHARFEPVAHAFSRRMCFAYLDLAELDRAFAGRWLWGVERRALMSFRRRDHFGDPSVPLETAVRDLVEQRLGARPLGPIRLLTQLRGLGVLFNPASFYFCFAPDGERLEALVAEVTNTPWLERHLYVLPARAEPGGPVEVAVAKSFHVSPFLPMDLDYAWRIAVPGERLELAIHALRDGRRVFAADVALERREITGWSLARALVRFPALPAQVVAGIYLHALRLWRRGVPFFPHPARAAHG